MNHFIIIICIILSFLLMFDSPAFSDDIKDVINVQILDKRIIAIRGEQPPAAFNLGLKETIQWYGAKGDVGAVLTSKRVIAVSASSHNWHEQALWVEEHHRHGVMLSDYLALLVTEKQIIVFDGKFNKWITASFPIHDEYVKAAIDLNVGVIITSKRAFGFATGSSVFSEISYRKGERFLSVTTKTSDVTVMTSSRLLIFSKSKRDWQEINIR